MIRFLLAAAGLLLSSIASADWMPEAGETLRFQLLDKRDQAIGELSFQFAHTPEGLQVIRSETMRTRKFFIKVDVDQTTTSLWQAGVLRSFVSDTRAETSIKNKNQRLTVEPDAEGKLLATVDGATQVLPADAWPMTLWHVGFMQRSQLFGTGGGELLAIKVQSGEHENLETPAGPRQCQRYEVLAEMDGRELENTLWYAEDGRLCAMLMNTGLGPIRYLPAP